MKKNETIKAHIIKITENKKAKFNYFVLRRIECGIVLKGPEVKSIKQKQVSLSDSYVVIKKLELFIIGLGIAKYKHGTYFNCDQYRTRKLLAHKSEINKLKKDIFEKKISLIPLSIYVKNGIIKVAICTCNSKTNYDKRNEIKKREAREQIAKIKKN